MGLVKTSSGGNRLSLPTTISGSVPVSHVGKTEALNIQGAGKLSHFVFRRGTAENDNFGLEIIADGSTVYDGKKVYIDNTNHGLFDKNQLWVIAGSPMQYVFIDGNGGLPVAVSGNYFKAISLPRIESDGSPGLKMTFEGIEFKKSLVINFSQPSGSITKLMLTNISYTLYI